MKYKCEFCRDWRVCDFGQEVMKQKKNKKMKNINSVGYWIRIKFEQLKRLLY